MPAPHSTPIPAATEARIRELLVQGNQISAINLAREHAGLSLRDAKDLVNSIAAAPPADRTALDGVPGDDPAALTAAFAADLRHARLMAGNPSYYRLADLARYSVPTISRALAGRTLPRWATAEAILQALGIARDQIDNQWRPQWARALEARDPSHPRHHGHAPAPEQAHHAPSPGSLECEDCGALISDLVQHQAWHWRIERQLRKTAIWAIDSAAQ
jgi:transcriptional regulator with XRE-family HTH domain